MSKYYYGDMQGKELGITFRVELRLGCVAVIDQRQAPRDIPQLGPNTAGVVKYWGGERHNAYCSDCGARCGGHWHVPKKLIDEAKELADQLNTEHGSGVNKELQP